MPRVWVAPCRPRGRRNARSGSAGGVAAGAGAREGGSRRARGGDAPRPDRAGKRAKTALLLSRDNTARTCGAGTGAAAAARVPARVPMPISAMRRLFASMRASRSSSKSFSIARGTGRRGGQRASETDTDQGSQNRESSSPPRDDGFAGQWPKSLGVSGTAETASCVTTDRAFDHGPGPREAAARGRGADERR